MPGSPPPPSGPPPAALPPTGPTPSDEGRSIGFVGAAGIGVGAIVGGGVFVLGGVAVAEAGPAAMLAFALNGAIALLTALTFAELATAFPRNGGQYVYARRAFSVRAAFGVGWIMTFAHVVAAVLYALGFAAYAVAALEALIPGVMAALPGGLARGLALLLALGATAAYGLVLLKGAPGGGQLENVGKLIVFAVLIAAGLAVIVQRGPAEALAPLDPFFEMGMTGVVAAMGFTFITFQGFELIAGVAGEVKAPRRNIPRAMFASLGIALAVYLPLLFVVTSVGVPQGIASPAAMAREFPETFFAEAASAYLGAFGFWLVIAAALLSTLTALRANLLAGSRVALAMARHRTLPRGLEKLHAVTHAPVAAIAFICISTAVLIVAVPNLAAAGAAASLIFLLTFGITHVAAWQVRSRAGGHIEGAFAAPFFPLVPLVGTAVCGLLIGFQVLTVPSAGLLLVVWLGFGAAIYAGFLSDRAEALDAAVSGRDPLFSRLRGRHTSVLVPLANPARAGGLASVAGALAPPQVGRILFHQVVVADEGTEEFHIRKAMEDGNAALSNALVRARREGLQTELLLTVAVDPWEEIARIAQEEEVNSVLLGLAQAPGKGEEPEEAGTLAHPIDRLLQRLPCDVSLLHGGQEFDMDQVRRVLIPLSGRNDHDRLRARVIGALSRKGLQHLAFLHVLPLEAPPQVEARAQAALEAYLRDEAQGAGEAYVARAEDPIAEVVARAEGFDLLVLGITRPRGGRSRMGELLARMVRESPCPVLIISHPPPRRGRGGARPF
ncbi:MAG: amino acid permease [Gemmatimonadales bacterium]|nr:MAG: amino acid permease [Gemmatimonadales bacterium]